MILLSVRRLLTLTLCGVLTSTVGTLLADPQHHVVLITIDGAAAYYLSDSNAPLPTLRRLAAEGTVAEGVRVSNPSVTWPNHTTLVTGVHPDRHGVLFNGVLTRPGPNRPVSIDPARDARDLVAVPTLYDVLHQARYATAEINWPCTRGAKTLDDSFPDVPEPILNMTPRLRDELVTRRIFEAPNDDWFRERSAAVRDQIWTAAAVHVLQKRRPNLLLFHLLICDSIQHKYGPQTPAAYAALAAADANVAEIVRTLDSTGLRRNTTLIVTADHGFDTALKLVQPNVVLRKAGLLEIGTAPGILSARAQIISEGGTAMVYFTDPSTRDQDRERVLRLLGRQEGVRTILSPDEFPTWHLPSPQQNPHMADLILVAESGYAFNNEARGEDSVVEVTLSSGNQGHHGFLTSNPKMRPLFVAWGRGIRPGAHLGLIDNIDIAPTIASLLGVALPQAEGKVLTNLVSATRP